VTDGRDDKWKHLICGVLYPIQFEQNPVDGIDRVLEVVVRARALNASPEQYLAAVQAALQSDEPLARLIPQPHSESVIRTYLVELQKRLVAGSD
jgi:hypothetical protein